MTSPTLRERLVRALARTVYRDDDPPPHIARICEPWADEIAAEVEAWAAEQTQRAEQAEKELGLYRDRFANQMIAASELIEQLRQAERERDEARAAVAEARAALDRASAEMAAAKVRFDRSAATHMEHAKAITDLSASRDEARAAAEDLRRNVGPDHVVGPYVDRILRALDRPEGT